MSETRRRTAARNTRRNAPWTAKNQPRQFLVTPIGNNLTTYLVPKLADFLAGRLADRPDKPPKFLREPLEQLNDPNYLALTGLTYLLDGIFRGWERDDLSAFATFRFKVGDDLHQRLRKRKILVRWGARERIQAGNWLIEQALVLDVFAYEDDGAPRISDGWLPEVAHIREWLIETCPDYAPLLLPPAPWTSLLKPCDGFEARFVRDWRPETKSAIEAAFLGDFPHARGVNTLAGVPLRIDPVMLDLVERFAVEIMGNAGDRRRADHVTVAADVKDAGWIGTRRFWNDHSCDNRGRVYALQHLNFARGDHVRSLFRFADGAPIAGDTYWLEIHCANCHGETDKKSREDRIKWVNDNRRDIVNIARNPVGTFDKWKTVGAPFAYVAACRELAAAWDDPENFVTHLPIGFDGSANGLQHLAMLIRDTICASLVNLVSDTNDVPSDIYATLIATALKRVETDKCEYAEWWRAQFKTLDDKQQRKLLKRPIMTFAYSVSLSGATEQIAEVYESFCKDKPTAKREYKEWCRTLWRASRYLAEKVLETCELELSGPKRVMDYICSIAEHCTSDNRFMEWTSPSGFPVSNRYQKPNLINVTCLRGSVRVARHRFADGVTPAIKRTKVKSSAAPNFIHSLDAAHLIAVVNAAANEGIVDLMTVHDCFYCLAPQAARLHEIILAELANLYRDNDPLADLRSRNVSDPDILPLPLMGTPIGAARAGVNLLLDGLIIMPDGNDTRFSFSPDRVRDAKNAFG